MPNNSACTFALPPFCLGQRWGTRVLLCSPCWPETHYVRIYLPLSPTGINGVCHSVKLPLVLQPSCLALVKRLNKTSACYLVSAKLLTSLDPLTLHLYHLSVTSWDCWEVVGSYGAQNTKFSHSPPALLGFSTCHTWACQPGEG